MNDCVQRWKHFANGKAWARITAHKEPMIEPRTAADLKASKQANAAAANRLSCDTKEPQLASSWDRGREERREGGRVGPG